MAQITLENIDAVTLRVLAAWATLQGKTVQELVIQRGINGVILEAMQNESNAQVTAETVAEDVKAVVVKDWSAVWQGLTANFNQTKSIPESLVAGLEAKAAAKAAA
jgi:DUF971 family protein